MKKSLLVLVFICIVSVLIISVKVFAQTATSSRVEVSFTYTKQNGFASNQFAVWIEDAQGRHVKTLYATRYTANGGWQRREHSLALWVKQSNLKEMNKTEVDAISGPTPKSGILHYTWDGTDSGGRAVAAGEYRVLVEGTLRNENCVVYTAVVKLGERSQVSSQAQYYGSSTSERGMIGPVTVICN